MSFGLALCALLWTARPFFFWEVYYIGSSLPHPPSCLLLSSRSAPPYICFRGRLLSSTAEHKTFFSVGFCVQQGEISRLLRKRFTLDFNLFSPQSLITRFLYTVELTSSFCCVCRLVSPTFFVLSFVEHICQCFFRLRKQSVHCFLYHSSGTR